MNVEVSPPAERTVDVELSEGEAYVLMQVLAHVYKSSHTQTQGDFLADLREQLEDARLANTQHAGVNKTHNGIRIYDQDTEW